MEKETTEVLAQQQVAVLTGLTLLVRAVSKQPGIDRERFVSDLIALLPPKGQDPGPGLLAMWREILETNL